MKTLICPDPCGHVIEGETEDEVMEKGHEHAKEAHPEMIAEFEAMSDEDKAKKMDEWRSMIQDKEE